MADHLFKPPVFGVDGHRRIAEYGLRTGGGDGNKSVIAVRQGVADVVQVAGYIFVLHFQVGDGSGAAGTPVDDAFPPVDQAFLVEAEKGGAHRPARPLVQGKDLPVPVAGNPQSLVLVSDGAAAVSGPLPHSFQELFPAQPVPVYSLSGQYLFDDHLGGDAGMVYAGEPEGRLAHHAVPAGQDILQGGGQGMPDVKLAGDVGWGHNDNEGLPGRVYSGLEVALLPPEPVPFLLHLARLVGFGHFVLNFWRLCHSYLIQVLCGDPIPFIPFPLVKSLSLSL